MSDREGVRVVFQAMYVFCAEKEYGMPFKKRKELLREVINTYVAERKAASAEEKPQPKQDAEPEEAAAGEEVRP